MAKGFTFSGSLNGHKTPIIRKMPVPNATAIEKGEPIDFTPGTGIIVLAEPHDLDDPIYAVSNEEKAANDGKVEIEVIPDPDATFRYEAAKAYTLTAGSTTVATDSSLQPQTDNFWKGGAIKILTCAADSSLVGKIVKISASTGATGVLTLAETLPSALAAGDTIYLCPGEFAEGHFGWDLDATSMHPDFDTTGGEGLLHLWSDPDKMVSIYKFRLHKLSNHVGAL